MNPAAIKLKEDLNRLTGSDIEDIRPFASGQNADLYLADVAGGARLVIKRGKPASSLETEAWMLRYLADHSELPVPKVHFADKTVLAMDYVPDCGYASPAVEEDAALHLARLHAIRADRYGLDRDTSIGSLTQANAWADDWIAFFRDYRLLSMARGAMEQGIIEPGLMLRIEHMAGMLDRWLTEIAPPSLVHGDLWSGNVLSGHVAVNAFIDPALYYADPEIELAFIMLFSTFGERFFKRYAEHGVIREGFYEVRRDIYMLYPLLVHARIYGRAYVDRVAHIVTRLVG